VVVCLYEDVSQCSLSIEKTESKNKKRRERRKMKGTIGVQGCLVAMITPLNKWDSVDREGLLQNLEFLRQNGVSGVVPVGTTGESPALDYLEHEDVIRWVTRSAQTPDAEGKTLYVLAGTGSNATKEARHYTRIAAHEGCPGVLLVDCYYNRPTPEMLQDNYYGPIAQDFPQLTVVPYVVSKRTGTEILVKYLVDMVKRFPNVRASKEANGLDRMVDVRENAPPEFTIFCGDDSLTVKAMKDQRIKAGGVISVIANIFPRAVSDMCKALLEGKETSISKALEGIFQLVSVEIPNSNGEVAANPVPIKTMMAGLGMPCGHLRQPLGSMPASGVAKIREELIQLCRTNPEFFEPIAKFYGIDVCDRLASHSNWDAVTSRR